MIPAPDIAIPAVVPGRSIEITSGEAKTRRGQAAVRSSLERMQAFHLTTRQDISADRTAPVAVTRSIQKRDPVQGVAITIHFADGKLGRHLPTFKNSRVS